MPVWYPLLTTVTLDYDGTSYSVFQRISVMIYININPAPVNSKDHVLLQDLYVLQRFRSVRNDAQTLTSHSTVQMDSAPNSKEGSSSYDVHRRSLHGHSGDAEQ